MTEDFIAKVSDFSCSFEEPDKNLIERQLLITFVTGIRD